MRFSFARWNKLESTVHYLRSKCPSQRSCRESHPPHTSHTYSCLGWSVCTSHGNVTHWKISIAHYCNYNRNTYSKSCLVTATERITQKPNYFPLDWHSHCTFAHYYLKIACIDRLFVAWAQPPSSHHSCWSMALHYWTHHSCLITDRDSVAFLPSSLTLKIRLFVVLMKAKTIELVNWHKPTRTLHKSLNKLTLFSTHSIVQ